MATSAEFFVAIIFCSYGIKLSGYFTLLVRVQMAVGLHGSLHPFVSQAFCYQKRCTVYVNQQTGVMVKVKGYFAKVNLKLQVSRGSKTPDLHHKYHGRIQPSAPESDQKQDRFSIGWQSFKNTVSGNYGHHKKMDRSQAGLGTDSFPAGNLFWGTPDRTQPAKTALPICNNSQILYQFLTFTQSLKRSLFY